MESTKSTERENAPNEYLDPLLRALAAVGLTDVEVDNNGGEVGVMIAYASNESVIIQVGDPRPPTYGYEILQTVWSDGTRLDPPDCTDTPLGELDDPELAAVVVKAFIDRRWRQLAEEDAAQEPTGERLEVGKYVRTSEIRSSASVKAWFLRVNGVAREDA